MAMWGTEQAEGLDPEDRQIVEKLAKLQSMYNQIGVLRTLLPEKLINPTRSALDNPDGYEPEILATYLQTAAQAGSRDVDRFKKDWHSDDVRELWHDVSTNDLPQGGDAWVMDYDSLLQNSGKHDHLSALVNGTSPLSHHLTEEETTAVVNAFRAKHPDLEIHQSPQANPPSLDLTMDQLGFHLKQDLSSSAIGYKVSGKANSGAPDLLEAIVQSVQTNEGNIGLATLLELLASYNDVTTRPCDKCGKLFTNKLDLPMVRQADVATSDGPPHFLALHHDCG